MRQIFTIIFIGVVSCISLGMIVFSFDPFRAEQYVKILFYVSLFATVWSSATIVFFYLRREGDNRFKRAFKAGFLLSVSILVIFLVLH
ncbi:MAG: hypothetical protein HYT62_04300 [Candidatus Yanofskybacteria bacterium]|nr:hypothetical protein [Candidatus Yanofskybacteria bacterium]